MADPIKTGIIGCGNISPAYLNSIQRLEDIEVVACADIRPERADAKAEEFGITSQPVADRLADPEIGIVLNLTTPQDHTEVNHQILNAGKHAHAEKPFGLNREEGKSTLALAKSKGLLVGSAPDTFLGGGLQVLQGLAIGLQLLVFALRCGPGALQFADSGLQGLYAWQAVVPGGCRLGGRQ